MLGPYLKPGGRAADIGCGMGFFTLGLAHLVGEKGRVYALDLQARMLAGVERRARRAGLAERVRTRQVRAGDLGAADLRGRLDLVLSFWMLHEVPDQDRFLAQVKELLKPGGVLYLAEPRMHVSRRDFAASLALAKELGFQVGDKPSVRMSRVVVLANR